MKLGPYLKLTAWLDLALLGFFMALALSGQVQDTFGWVFLGLITAFIAFRAYRRFKRARTTREEERVYAPPTDATPDERRAYYKRFLWIGAIAFPILSAIYAHDIYELQTGAVDAVRLDRFTSFAYEQMGPWPAVLVVPMLGVFVIGGMAYMLKRNREGRDLPRA